MELLKTKVKNKTKVVPKHTFVYSQNMKISKVKILKLNNNLEPTESQIRHNATHQKRDLGPLVTKLQITCWSVSQTPNLLLHWHGHHFNIKQSWSNHRPHFPKVGMAMGRGGAGRGRRMGSSSPPHMVVALPHPHPTPPRGVGQTTLPQPHPLGPRPAPNTNFYI